MMRIGLLGYGTVGAGVDELSKRHPELHVDKIFSRTYRQDMGTRAVFSFDAIVTDPNIDTVVEVIGGIHPAYEYVREALAAGKNVVTANKALLAAYFPELSEIAKKSGASLLFSASAGGGIPWLKNLSRMRELDRILSIRGIMNGTTNFILDEMTREGADFAKTLKKAQELGFAEADPSSDIDGDDTRRKLVLSMITAFSAYVPETEIPTFGIRHISSFDIREAAVRGRTVRLVGYAGRNESGSYSAFVLPVFFPDDSLESSVKGCDNCFACRGEQIGEQTFIGQGAGRYPTAGNVIRDLLDLNAGAVTPLPKDLKASSLDHNASYRFYLRSGTSVETPVMKLSDFCEEIRKRLKDKEPLFAALLYGKS